MGRNLLILGALFCLTGCEVLFWLTLNPAGLPCKTNLEAGETACVAGYVCIEGLCQLADAQGVGQACTIDDECEDGLVCRDHYLNDANQCENDQYDRICETGDSSVNSLSGGKACREVCDPSNIESWTSVCENGEFCFPDRVAAVSGYCQAGNCRNDTECGNDALCVFKDVNPDPTDVLGGGLCFETCSPLNCNPVGGCVGCRTDDDVDGDNAPDVMNCAPRESLERLVCQKAGPGQRLDNCLNQEDCGPGLACINEQCLAWCTTVPGEPDCNAGEICNAVSNSPVNNLGYCF